MTEKQSTFKEWLLPVLVSLLLLIASISFFQNRTTQKSVEILNLQVAVLSNQLSNHISWGEGENSDNIALITANDKRLDAIEQNYMKRDDILAMLENMRKWVNDNYQKK